MLKRILFFIVLSVLFVACKSDKQNESDDIKKIKIETSQNKFDINAIYEIKLRVLKPRNAQLKNKQITWVCCDTTQNQILQIIDTKNNENCSIRFLQKGKVRIKAIVGEAEDTITLKTRSNNIGWWLLCAIIILIGGYALGYLNIVKLRNNNKSKKQPQNNLHSKELKNLTLKYNKLLEEKEEYINKHKTLVSKYNQLAKDYNLLGVQYDELIDKYKKMKKQSIPKVGVHKTNEIKKADIKDINQTTEKTANNNSIMYADCIVDNFFNKVTNEPDEDTVFEFHAHNNMADFVIYSGAKRRIIANPAYLDGCEKQIIGDSDVIVDETGIAQIQMDGKWKIINSLKVIIK